MSAPGAVAAPIVSIRGLTASRGRDLALEDVDLEIHAGEIHGLAGPNGAGKTTLLRCLLGLLPFTGAIRLALEPGEPIGYVPQSLDLDPALPVSVGDFLALALARAPLLLRPSAALRERIVSALAETGAEGLEGRRLSELSGGELRRVLLAQALVPRPTLLVLDEPASHVDEEGTRLFESLLARLAREGAAILIVEHDLELLTRLCTRVTVLNRRVVSSRESQGLPAGAAAGGAGS